MRNLLNQIIILFLIFIATHNTATADLIFYHEDNFFRAAQIGDTESVEALIKEGADVNAKDKKNVTPILLASAYGNHDVVKLLIENGANVNYQIRDNQNLFSPLNAASAYSGRADVVELLLLNGADINIKNKEGLTPLHLAAKYGHPEVIEVLIKHGAKLYKRDNQGLTALETAIKEPLESTISNHEEVISILKFHQKKIYLQYGGTISFFIFASLLIILKMRDKRHNQSLPLGE